jgi:hypothetical protein
MPLCAPLVGVVFAAFGAGRRDGGHERRFSHPGGEPSVRVLPLIHSAADVRGGQRARGAVFGHLGADVAAGIPVDQRDVVGRVHDERRGHSSGLTTPAAGLSRTALRVL